MNFGQEARSRPRLGGFSGRLAIAAVIAIISIITYFSRTQFNEVTNEKQRVAMSKEQEIALGLQAAPEMAAQHGGAHPDAKVQQVVDQIGHGIVQNSDAKKADYQYEFTVLKDPDTINAFALPGGQVFITYGLFKQLKTEAELAGVLGHEIGHVVARHSAEHLAKAQLTQGLTGAAVIASYDPNRPGSGQTNAAIAAAIGSLVNMKYGRADEIESDFLGVRFMAEAGYDPRAMLKVMEVLAQSSKGGRQPEFFSTHPNPERRMERIQEAITKQFPNGVPEGLKS